MRNADDTNLITESEKELQDLVDTIVLESKKVGLSLNGNKTKTMVISKKTTKLSCSIKVEDKDLEQVEKFKYLGTWITSDGKSETEIKTRIGQAKAAFQKMNNIFTDRKIDQNLKMRLLQCCVEPVLLYACETWTLTKEQ